MDYLSLAIGLALGSVLAAVFTALGLGGKAKQVQQKYEQARRELERLKSQNAEQLKQLQSNQADSNKELGSARQKVQGLERSVTQHLEELQRLRETVAAAERARDQALEQANSRQAARVQAEGKLKQAEKLASESLARLEELEAQLKQALTEHETLAKTADRRSEEIRRLRADLTAAHEGASASGLESSIEVFADTDGSLQVILDTLLEREGLRAAVLADVNGIVIASAGDPVLRDGIAATAQLISTMGARFEGMVPFGKIRSFRVTDTESVAIAGRTFNASGETVAIATYGLRPPNDRVLDGATASLNAALE